MMKRRSSIYIGDGQANISYKTPTSNKRNLLDCSYTANTPLNSIISPTTSNSTVSPSITISTLSKDQNIRVVSRIRPLLTKEYNEKSIESIQALEEFDTIVVDKTRKFVYDAVFGKISKQKFVYENTAADLIHNIFKGFNVTVLAYGQTGSGKTHTMFGGTNVISQNPQIIPNLINKNVIFKPSNDDGIIPRAVYDLFDTIRKNESGNDAITRTFKVKMSYIEIYNEELRDLLSKNGKISPELQIRESKTDGVIIQNLSLHDVSSPNHVAELMKFASERRSIASTLMNSVSSRSHAICTLYVKISSYDHDNFSEEKTNAKLTLVDLAGSERLKRTGAKGCRMKEGIHINKGLFVLGQVVSALSELSQKQRLSSSSYGSNSMHIKYRDSKLTRILQDSLGGNSKTVMVACISPADANVEESINTLRYAERTRNIKNIALKNFSKDMSLDEASALRRENKILKRQINEVNAKLNEVIAEKIRTDQIMTKLKIRHSEEIEKVLKFSTRNVTEQCSSVSKNDQKEVNGNVFNDIVDSKMKAFIDGMVNDYMSNGNNKVVEGFHKSEGLKKKKKGNQDKSTLDEDDRGYNENSLIDSEINSDSDSDWNPYSPIPRKKLIQKSQVNKLGLDASLDYSTNLISEEMNDLENLKVSKLRKVCQGRGLLTSGKKAELIARIELNEFCPLSSDLQ